MPNLPPHVSVFDHIGYFFEALGYDVMTHSTWALMWALALVFVFGQGVRMYLKIRPKPLVIPTETIEDKALMRGALQRPYETKAWQQVRLYMLSYVAMGAGLLWWLFVVHMGDILTPQLGELDFEVRQWPSTQATIMSVQPSTLKICDPVTPFERWIAPACYTCPYFPLITYQVRVPSNPPSPTMLTQTNRPDSLRSGDAFTSPDYPWRTACYHDYKAYEKLAALYPVGSETTVYLQPNTSPPRGILSMHRYIPPPQPK